MQAAAAGWSALSAEYAAVAQELSGRVACRLLRDAPISPNPPAW